jgi:hypothetical protein
MPTIFWLENLKGIHHLKELDVDGDNIRLDIREIRWGGVAWMYVAQGRDQWRNLVNTVMSFRVL